MKVQNASILITGGAGLIGSHLLPQLIRKGAGHIRILDNLSRGSKSNLSSWADLPQVELIEADIRATGVLEKAINDVDYCFHMASPRINHCFEDPEIAYTTMVEATHKLVEASVQNKVKKVIFSSSASVYGQADQFPTPETQHPYHNTTIYGAYKLFGEQLLHTYFHRYGLNYVALRYFNVFGPNMDREGKYTELLMKWMDRLQSGEKPLIFGDGTTTLDLVAAQDIAAANVLALEYEGSEKTFNIGSGKEYTLIEILKVLCTVMGVKYAPVFADENKINPVTRRYSDISRAKKILNFTPSLTLEEGIRELYQWYTHANTTQ